MNRKICFHGIFCVMAFASMAAAQTKIVDASGATAGSVTTINEALADSAVTEIVVKNTGVYEEALLVTRNIVIRGEDPNDRPVIALKGLPSQPAMGPGDGIYLGGDGVTGSDLSIEFSNFILIPNLDASMTDDAINACPSAGFQLNLTMENILIAPNNGSNAPLATSVWDDPDFGAAGVLRVADDGVCIMTDPAFGGVSGIVNADIDNLVIIGVGGANATGESLVCYAGDGSIINATGLGFSYSVRTGAQIANNTTWNVTGTREKPGWVSRKHVLNGILFYNGKVTMDHVVLVDNSSNGIRVDVDGVESMDISDSLFANNLGSGYYTDYPAAYSVPHNLEDSTFYGNGPGVALAANVRIGDQLTNAFVLNVKDSVMGGSSSIGLLNQGSLSTINVSNTGLPTSGPDVLLEVIGGSSVGVVNVTNSVSDDPGFVNPGTTPVAPDGFDITGGAYATASSTNGPLNGWGDGPPSASVPDWAIY